MMYKPIKVSWILFDKLPFQPILFISKIPIKWNIFAIMVQIKSFSSIILEPDNPMAASFIQTRSDALFKQRRLCCLTAIWSMMDGDKRQL